MISATKSRKILTCTHFKNADMDTCFARGVKSRLKSAWLGVVDMYSTRHECEFIYNCGPNQTQACVNSTIPNHKQYFFGTAPKFIVCNFRPALCVFVQLIFK